MEPEYLEAAKFLPQLPKSNLDDRTFEELVEECLLRIPRYCPEWTNYNPGDPGITLIELFSWLVHQMLYRFNQVPRRHYVALLELLGIRLQPPRPAQTALTFYLTKAQAEPKSIPAGTEVATVRTATQEAIIFTTDQALIIGQPQIKHLLRSPTLSDRPTAENLSNRFRNSVPEQTRQWGNLAVAINLFEPCQPGSSFYLVLEPAGLHRPASAETELPTDAIAGNILAFTFRGPAAVTTGINTDNPPLRWQAWNGDRWVDGILRQQQDDRTKGFSFDKLGQAAPNPEQEGADVILHLPQHWPVTEWGGYQGQWIRCVYEISAPDQYGYERSPEIIGLQVRSIGGTVSASECVQVSEEFLGVSDGKPGQVFELEGQSVLSRLPEEHIWLRLPNGEREDWQEVSDLADSNEQTCHYLLDSKTGSVQFGPLIREPSQIAQQTYERSRLQSWGRPVRSRSPQAPDSAALPAVLDPDDRALERQYGKVPPLGAEIYMSRYRVGGGSRGNLQAEKLTVMKTSIPYVKSVINYVRAEGGLDAESLDDAVMRVPALLRTRKTALTPEDFEHLARRLELPRPIYRAHTITLPDLTTPGVVRLLVIPDLPTEARSLERGIHPDQFLLDDTLKRELTRQIDLHKALGIRVQPEPPQLVGVQVVAEVLLQPQYRNPEAAAEVSPQIKAALYHFLNPITGGFEQTGWPLGRAVQVSDIIALLQSLPTVSYVAHVKLFSLRPYGEERRWLSLPIPEGVISLSPLEVACSWADNELETGHVIELIT
ncbi:putative baseplate assembly protein [Sphaerothrix gracilis]|uniref:putative baseplate assembly protein n=1 Tax=Sphaerothrix gracilis TaxID=3151835 RepID=UPI0031FD5788